MKIKLISCFILLVFFRTAIAQNNVDVLIIGGGAGGTSAAIQAARMGSSVLVLEKTPWLGGMLTAAGVSAIDGNHKMPSGIWGEFREALYTHYGGPKAVATGWVSHTLFEPALGNKILQNMTKIPNLRVAKSVIYHTITELDDGWIVVWTKEEKKQVTKTKILIDATETGELLPIVGAKYRLGMDSREDTREAEAPELANSIVQDLTYVAILEDLGNIKSKAGLVKKPKGYDPKIFECSCKREGGEMFGAVSDCEQMLNYGKLPNNKYMINWPNCGNDHYVDLANLSTEEREEALEEAKQHTLKFVYYIQNDLGYKNLRLADEFPTKDKLPFIAYNREARRVKGKVFLMADHLARPYAYNYFRTGIAVGDYPIDHHHDKQPKAPEINFINIKIPSYTIPLGTLMPANIENFIVAEKNISVSNIVNGTTRLQPVVLGIGQAAGALASLAVSTKVPPSEVPVRKVQQALLDAKAYIMPFIDLGPEDAAFGAIQRIGATGILKGFGVPYKWANETWFYPNRVVSEYEWSQGMAPYFPEVSKTPASGSPLTLKFLSSAMENIGLNISIGTVKENWSAWGLKQAYDIDAPLNRRSVSLLTDRIFKPFEVPIAINGTLKTKK